MADHSQHPWLPPVAPGTQHDDAADRARLWSGRPRDAAEPEGTRVRSAGAPQADADTERPAGWGAPADDGRPPRWGKPAASPLAAEPASAPPWTEQRPSLLKRLGAPLFAALALLAKFGKGVLVLLKGAKFLSTSATMLVSVAAYAVLWGWRFAVGFVALLFVHEMGHYVQLRREGVKPSGMLFIPFLGAVIGTRSLGGSAIAEARVGLAGPILGTLGALACIPIALATDSDLWRALAFTGLFLNLFNLLPVVPLDGGRAMAAMSPWMWFLGLGLVALLAFTFPNPVVFLILLFAALETWRRWKARKSGEEGNEAYYRVTGRQRLLVGAVYLGLIAVCVLGMDATFIDRSAHL
jgi:Zn-dependent protease